MSNSLKFSGGGGGGGSGDVVFIETQTASASATIDFTDLSSTYFEYIIYMANVIPATSGADLWMRTSTNNGTSYDAGAANYSYDGLAGTSTGATQILLDINVANTASIGVSGSIRIFNPSSTVFTKVIMSGSGKDATTGDASAIAQSGIRESAADVDAVRIMFSTGNISSGKFTLYGVVA